jgi:hypothetical protein
MPLSLYVREGWVPCLSKPAPIAGSNDKNYAINAAQSRAHESPRTRTPRRRAHIGSRQPGFTVPLANPTESYDRREAIHSRDVQEQVGGEITGHLS